MHFYLKKIHFIMLKKGFLINLKKKKFNSVKKNCGILFSTLFYVCIEVLIFKKIVKTDVKSVYKSKTFELQMKIKYP